MLNEQDMVNLYYDHYKDTQEIIRNYISKRDKYTIILFCLLAIIAYFTIDETTCSQIITEILNNKLGLSTIRFQVINILLLSSLLFISLQYYQICLNIEKSYHYIHNVENTLSEMSQINIDRESTSYLNNYPKTSKLAHIFYTYLLPLLIVGLLIFKLIIELKGNSIAIKIVDGTIIGSMLVFSFVYLIDRVCLQAKIMWSDIFIKPFQELLAWLRNNKCCAICISIFLVLSLIVIFIIKRTYFE